MSVYGTKVVAVLDTKSAFGTTIKQLRDNVQTLLAGQAATPTTLSFPTTQPQNPSEGQPWFDKSSLKLKIYISDGNSSQWVEV